MAELVYAHDSKSCSSRIEGSIPSSPTKLNVLLGVQLGAGKRKRPEGSIIKLAHRCLHRERAQNIPKEQSDDGFWEIYIARLPSYRYNRASYAGVAQLIERFLAKEEATSLSLVTRTKYESQDASASFLFCGKC